MSSNIPNRRKYNRYKIKNSTVIFCSTLIGKIADVSMGGIQMVHTGTPRKFMGELCKISIMGKDFALEFQAQMVSSTKINKFMNLCRFKFVALTENNKGALKKFIDASALP